jgi:hypothetical protein
MKIAISIFTSSIILFSPGLSAQQTDSTKLDYRKIYSFCLDADVKSALTYLNDVEMSASLTEKDLTFKKKFESRFSAVDLSDDYLQSNQSSIDDLLKIYLNYWHFSLLNKEKNFDSLLVKNLNTFLKSKFLLEASRLTHDDSVDLYLKKYIELKGFHTTGFSKTGKLFDLLVWKSEKDTTYSFSLHDEKINAHVILMDNFITLGWEEYATLERFYPGGWATKEALYCVKKAYDLESEDFQISFLAHEGQHFTDYKLFSKLSSADLEYRAKLIELSMAKKSLFNIIASFIANANYESENGHSVANYCVIRDLSRVIFHSEFEKDLQKWRSVGESKINNVSYALFLSNTKKLKSKGTGVERFIK